MNILSWASHLSWHWKCMWSPFQHGLNSPQSDSVWPLSELAAHRCLCNVYITRVKITFWCAASPAYTLKRRTRSGRKTRTLPLWCHNLTWEEEKSKAASVRSLASNTDRSVAIWGGDLSFWSMLTALRAFPALSVASWTFFYTTVQWRADERRLLAWRTFRQRRFLTLILCIPYCAHAKCTIFTQLWLKKGPHRLGLTYFPKWHLRQWRAISGNGPAALWAGKGTVSHLRNIATSHSAVRRPIKISHSFLPAKEVGGSCFWWQCDLTNLFCQGMTLSNPILNMWSSFKMSRELRPCPNSQPSGLVAQMCSLPSGFARTPISVSVFSNESVMYLSGKLQQTVRFRLWLTTGLKWLLWFSRNENRRK